MPRWLVITAAMCEGNKLQKIRESYPKQFFDVGICEKSRRGLRRRHGQDRRGQSVDIYSTFLQRSYDQIFQEVALQNLPVVFCLDRAGLVGADGPTHHGSYDIAYMRAPQHGGDGTGDEATLVHMLRTAIEHDGPAARRYPRGAAVGVEVPDSGERIPIGTGETLRNGEQVALLGDRTGVGIAEEAADLLAAGGLNVTVADARFVKPLDTELVERLALGHDLLVTIEEGVLQGGFGSAVLEHLEDSFPNPGERARVMRVGLPDRYVTHGKPDLLHEEVGFTGEVVAEKVGAALGRVTSG